jgi:hypothetical protein
MTLPACSDASRMVRSCVTHAQAYFVTIVVCARCCGWLIMANKCGGCVVARLTTGMHRIEIATQGPAE